MRFESSNMDHPYRHMEGNEIVGDSVPRPAQSPRPSHLEDLDNLLEPTPDKPWTPDGIQEDDSYDEAFLADLMPPPAAPERNPRLANASEAAARLAVAHTAETAADNNRNLGHSGR
ncbi:MAG TPA: hypothetical protein VF733_04715 [Candidatus Saccharimonadales bacterium]